MIKVMKMVSIQGLKAQLSAMVAEAESGDTIIITRHHRPVAQLSPARTESVHRGRSVGSGRIKAARKARHARPVFAGAPGGPGQPLSSKT